MKKSLLTLIMAMIMALACTTSNVQAENLRTEEIRHNSIPAISENLLQTFPRALYILLLKFYIFQPESQNLLQVPTFCKTLIIFFTASGNMILICSAICLLLLLS